MCHVRIFLATRYIHLERHTIFGFWRSESCTSLLRFDSGLFSTSQFRIPTTYDEEGNKYTLLRRHYRDILFQNIHQTSPIVQYAKVVFQVLNKHFQIRI